MSRMCMVRNSLRFLLFFFYSSRRLHTRYWRDWSSDVCSSDLTDRGRFTLTPSAIARSLTFPAHDDGRITPTVDVKKLRSAAGKELAKVEVKAEEARDRKSVV